MHEQIKPKSKQDRHVHVKIKRKSLQEHEPLPSSGSNKDSMENLSIGGTREVPISSPFVSF